MKLLADIAWTHIRGRRRQSLLSITGVALGVGFFISISALMAGSDEDFIERVVDATPHVALKDEFRLPPRQPVDRIFPTAAVALEGTKPKQELRGIRRAKARLAEIDALPDSDATPVLTGNAVVRFSGKDLSISIIGIDPDRERRVSKLAEDMEIGELNDLHSTANGIIAGDGLADKLGAKMGDTLTVTSPAGITLRMKIVGLFHSGALTLDDRTAYALLKKVQVLQDKPNIINEIRIRLDNIDDARLLAKRLEARYGYRAESWDEVNEGILETLVVRRKIMISVVGAILLVAGFGIYNVVSTITYEKVRDIAIMKSLGFTAGDIKIIFLLEGLVIGLAGVIVGWGLGYLISVYFDGVEIDMKEFTDETTLPIRYAMIDYVIAAAFALFASTIAGFLPARKAARVKPVDIIRGAA